jgi:hypothetical protein
MRVKISENIYKMMCELRLMYGAEIWGLKDGWKGADVIQRRYCKKVLLRIPRFAVNRISKLELGRDSMRGKILCLAVKYWLLIPQMHKKEIVRGCYELQISYLKFGSWAIKLSEELDKIGLVYIWQDPQENSVSRTCTKMKERRNDVE